MSLHYFHSFAVKDRCSVTTGLTDNPSLPDIRNVDVNIVLPSETDHHCLKRNMSVLAARIVTKHIPFFKRNVKLEHHILHPFSAEMARKSDTVLQIF